MARNNNKISTNKNKNLSRNVRSMSWVLYLKPISGTTVDKRRELTESISKCGTNGTETNDDVEPLLDAGHIVGVDCWKKIEIIATFDWIEKET